MKSLKILSFLSIAVLIGSLLFVANSCKKDPCKDVTCQNGGTTEAINDNADCQCNCMAGYEGEFCADEMRAKFIGSYDVADACSGSGSSNYSVTIATSTDVTKVLISNVWDSFTNPVTATIDGTTLTIANQEPDGDGFTVSGTGTYANGVINVTYSVTETSTGTVDNCNSTWTKQ